MKMGPIGCPETLVRNHHYSLRNGSADTWYTTRASVLRRQRVTTWATAPLHLIIMVEVQGVSLIVSPNTGTYKSE
jgi:hypothetical protein